MKTLVTMVSLSLMLVACGKNESGDSSSSKSSTLSVLSNQGITFESQPQTNSYAGNYSYSEIVTIRCNDNSRAGVNNQTRMARIDELIQSTYNRQNISINGKNYDSQSFRALLEHSRGYLQYASQYASGYNNNTGYNNNGGGYITGGIYYQGYTNTNNNYNNNYYNNNNTNNNYNNNNTNYERCPDQILGQGQVFLAR